MALLKDEVFVCLDTETTGLDPHKDRIVEVAVCTFNFQGIIESFASLIDPECPISETSLEIHRITPEMLQGKPKIEEVLPQILKIINRKIIVGHGIGFDLALLINAAKRHSLPHGLSLLTLIDTLRLARYYGNSPNNSLENLGKHFNVPVDETHRAMSDVMTNIEVFKHLAKGFRTTEELLKLLSRPIRMKVMPLGKYKGRLFSEIPQQYLEHAASLDFDQDLLYSIRVELKNRKKGNGFTQSANPFLTLE